MRDQAPTSCPTPRTTWSWSGLILSLALATSLAWYFFWVAMASIELDIKHIVNWYFFARFNLTTVPQTYQGLERVGYWMPLFVFAIFLSSRLVCPCRTYLNKVPPVIYTAVVLHNTLFFVYMMVAGGKIIAFFQLVLPIQLVFQIHNLWWLLLLAPTLSVLVCYLISCEPIRHNLTCEQPLPAPSVCCLSIRPAAVGLLVIIALHFSIPLLVQWLVEVGCRPCQEKLPKKPGLIAHRGCGFVYPENTIMSFVHSSQIPGMIGLETDVQVSYDGVPFLLHDPHTIRTTDVISKCPDVDPLGNATWLNFTTGSCPLDQLNVGSWFTEKQTDEDAQLPKEFSEELMPSLYEYLLVAKKHEMRVIFDIREPNVAHPFHDNYINTTLRAVLASGLQLTKVWWLAPHHRDWVLAKHPNIVQVTKTEDTPFVQFHEQKIRIVNDDWSTPLETVRKYQRANLSINFFFVDSVFAFSYAWCVGADSVTTNNCKQLASLSRNKFHKVCYNLRHSVEQQLWPITVTFLLCSLSCMTCFECMQRMRRKP